MKKSLHITAELAVIFGVCLLGELIAEWLPFDFSASVLSMIILLLLLIVKALKFESIKATANFLTSNMAVLFVPYGVKVLQYLDIIKENLVLFLLIVLVTTPVVYGVTALTASLIIKLQKGEKE
ncbi:MAG: CidA/LrgA family protein [Clostridia bacterium]|nr:CidA/LrgA family protein [Clostridia bacterium]